MHKKKILPQWGLIFENFSKVGGPAIPRLERLCGHVPTCLLQSTHSSNALVHGKFAEFIESASKCYSSPIVDLFVWNLSPDRYYVATNFAHFDRLLHLQAL